jgi:phosphatidylserine synthase
MLARSALFASSRRHAANLVSLLGVLLIGALALDGGRDYLVPVMLANNIMDDLDGIVAAKLGIRSQFGARLDNVCDAIAHTAFVMVIGMPRGGLCAAAGLAAVAAIIVRSVSRLTPGPSKGSPTNELVRHLLFVLLLTEFLGASPTPFLTVVFVFHTVSMLVTYRMPQLIRSVTTSATAIGLLNVTLIVAWLVPYATPFIAASFMLTYLYSFAKGAVGPIKREAPGA